ncbi:undecaprenyl-phosphate glucose phosphotransferase [Bacteroidia bacterium]|nr:undecaprenyl-phosphate glucose phosphotransferase [Bacteroidia bacterium]
MNNRENNLRLIYFIIDLVLLNLVVLLAYELNLGGVQTIMTYSGIFYLLQANFALLVIYFTMTSSNLYLRDSYQQRLLHISKRVAWFFCIIMILSFLFMKGNVARWFLFYYTLIFYVSEIITYYALYFYMRTQRNKGWHIKRILLVGYNEQNVLLRTMVEKDPMMGYKFVGYIKYDERDINTIPENDRPFIFGNVSQLEQIILDTQAEVVFSAFSFFYNKSNTQEQLITCNKLGVRLYLVTEHQRWLGRNGSIESLGDLYIINLQHIPLDEFSNRITKRAFDIAFSSVVLLVTGVTVFPFIALWVKCTDGGPVFFSQLRTGLNNRDFQCHKFRSMRVNKLSDTQQAISGDPRITSVGRFMRKTNMDELPQFFNVLRGEMSIVGPRPHMLKHTEQYSELIRNYKVRHYVKPGITGWAQVSGYRGETDQLWKMEKRVKYDMDYIEGWSFLWDLKIIWLTVFGKETYHNAG